MADIQSNIDINIDTSGALASIKSLQRQISAFHTQMAKSGAVSNASLANMQQNLINGVNASGAFSAQMKTIKTTTESFTTSLEKNKLSMGEYFRYAGASTKTFGKLFKGEFDTINKVARERVKDLQTQYIKLGRDANGAMQSIAVRPLALDMNNLATQTQIAAQKHQIFNQLITQGSTNMLNFGKNTQWAGRQLMVGFSVPLALLGSMAAKEFMKIEEQAIRLKRVYGDMTTPTAEGDKMVAQISDLASAYTKYGVAVKDTMGLAADAAAMGKKGADLMAQVADATRLSVLGGVDQKQALETTISLTNAFGVSSEQLAGKVDFLNAVENQTVTSIEDLTTAIPKAGPVVQQLGGNVNDLAFFLTAMKEGGINASEGANALKSGLASMINPTQQATDMLNGFGINLKSIIDNNAGNVSGMIVSLAHSLDTLDPLNRAQAIEQLFGKFQFARMSTLFQNVIKEGSQAQQVLSLSNATAEELAVLSERELKRVEDSPMYKFKGAMEDFKKSLAPVGEAFLKAVTPIVEFGTKILDKFNSMSDGAKSFVVILVTAVAGIGPVLLMTFGLLANGVANIIKMFLGLGNMFGRLKGQTGVLGETTQYMTQEQLQAAAVAASLEQSHMNLTQAFTSERQAIALLVAEYQKAIAVQARFTGPAGRGGRGAAPKKFASGTVFVPGTGNGDTTPAMLTPGEAVIPKGMAKKYAPLIAGMIAGSIPGYATGKMPTTGRVLGGTVASREFSPLAMMAPGNTTGGFGMDKNWLKTSKQAEAAWAGALKSGLMFESGVKLTQKSYDSFSTKFNGVTADLLKIFRSEVTPDVKKVAQVGKAAWPKMQAHIKELEKQGQLSAQEAKALTDATRKLVAAEKADLTQRSVRRTEIGTNAQGQSVVKRVSTERIGTTLKPQVMRATDMELRKRNLPPIAGQTFAHIPDHPPVSRYTEPTTSARNTPAEQALVKLIQNKAKIAVGQILGTFGPEIDKQAASASPSKRAVKAAAKNIVDGAIKPIEEAKPRAQKAGQGIAGAATQAGRANNAGQYRDPVTGRYAVNPNVGKPVPVAGGGVVGGGGMGKVAGASMALSGITMAASMMPGQIGQMAQAAMGPMMALSAVTSLFSMGLSPALVGVIAAIAAAGVAFMMIKGAFDDAKSKALAFGESLGSGTKAMDKFAEFSGKVTGSQAMDKKRQNQLAAFETQNGKSSFGDNYLKEDAGKALVKSIGEAAKGGDMLKAKSLITNQMASAVASGALDPNQARSIVASLAREVGDYNFGIQVNGSLMDLIGPNGENLITDPLTVRMKLMQDTQDQVKSQMTGAGEMGRAGTQGVAGGAMAAGGAVLAGIGVSMVPAMMASVAAATSLGAAMGSIVPVAGTLVGAAVGLGVGIWQGVEGFKALGQEAGTNVAMGLMALEQQQQMIDSLDLEYQKRIDTARAAGDEAKADELSLAHVEARNKLLAKGAETMNLVVDNYKNADFMSQGAMGQAADEAIKNKYKDNPLLAQVAQSAQDKIVAAGGLNQAQEYQMKLSLATGSIDPQMMLNLMNQFGENSKVLTDVINVTTNLGTADGGMALQLMNMFKNPEMKTEFMATVSAKTPGDAKKYIDLFADLQKTGEVVDLQTTLEYFVKNPKAADKAQSQMEELKAESKKGPITLTIIEKIFGAEVGNIVKANQKYFNSLPKDQQITYTTVIETIYSTKGEKQTQDAYKNWAKANEGRKGKNGQVLDTSFDTYANIQASKVTAANVKAQSVPADAVDAGATSGGSGGGAAQVQASALDDLLKKMRDVKGMNIDLTKGWNDSRVALDNMFGGGIKGFNGLEQQMRRLGGQEDLISLVAGMDPEEYARRKDELFTFDAAGNITAFRNSLMSIGEAMRAITMGDFQSKNEKTVRTIQTQTIAVNKLVAAGMSYTDAYETVQDTVLANAIAMEKDNATLKETIRLTNEAATASKNLAAAKAVAQTGQDLADQQKLAQFLQANAGKLTDQQTAAIIGDKNLQTLALSPTFDPVTFQTALNNVADKAAVELKIKKMTIDGLESVFNDGFSKAMEAFSAKEQQITLDFKIKKAPFEEIIKQAQRQISTIQNQTGGLDDMEAELVRISEKERQINEKYQKRADELDKIEKANEAITRQQKAQLSVADALSSGDIAAAARAAQELRAQQAADAAAKTRQLLDLSKQKELASVTGVSGQTRAQIEEKIRDLKQQIFDIEENIVEPAQRQLEIIGNQESDAKSVLTVLGMTKDEWERIKNNTDLAKTSGEKYKTAMQDALGVVQDILTYWNDLDGKEVSIDLGYTQTVTPLPNTPTAGNIAPAAMPSSGGGGGGGAEDTGIATADANPYADEYLSGIESGINAVKPKEDFWDGVVKGWNDFWGGVIQPIINIFAGISLFFYDYVVAPIWNWIFNNILVPIGSGFADIWNTVVGFFVAVFQPIIAWIYDNILVPIGTGFAEVFTAIGDFFATVWGTVATWFHDNVIQPIIDGWNGFIGFFIDLWKAAQEGPRAVEAFILNVVQNIGKFFGDTINNIGGFFSGLIGNIGRFIGGIPGFFRDAVNGALGFLGGIWNWFTRLPGLIGDSLSGLATKMGSAIKGALNGMFDLARGVNLFGWKPFAGLPRLATGGQIPGSGNEDNYPAMLMPGEYVIKKDMVAKYGSRLMEDINSGKFSTPNFDLNSYSGPQLTDNGKQKNPGSVYNSNYSINVNVKSDANADQIARTVITQIKQIDAQRIRGNRF